MKSRIAYIAGPMTGLPNWNRAAFLACEDRLALLGWEVRNPARVRLAEGATWSDYMRADLLMLCEADALVLLEGWQASNGARLECTVAQALGMAIWEETKIPRANA